MSATRASGQQTTRRMQKRKSLSMGVELLSKARFTVERIYG
jgi:hypothetical protein